MDSAGGLSAAKHLILGQVLFGHPLPRSRIFMVGLGGIPSAWCSPTTRSPGGQHSALPLAELAMLAPGGPGGSPRGGRWDATWSHALLG